MGRVLLVDCDSKDGFPNLALMKLSAYEKEQGNKTELIKEIPETRPLVKYDRAYVSCIFEQNREKALDFIRQLDCQVTFGGTGLDFKKKLSEGTEHIMPDYDLYDTDFSMGFTSRGCIRKCPWCVVPEKEGMIHNHAPITEFLHPDHDKVILLDNNFTASPKLEENLDFLIDRELKVNFNQGIDIRLVDEELASRFAETQYHDWRFKRRTLYFAFDTMRVKDAVVSGIENFVNAGIHPRRLCVYVLVGFNTTVYEDLERINILLDLNVDPYVMRYNQTEGYKGILKHLARWVNWRIYRHCDFLDYDEGDSQEVIQEVFSKRPPKSWDGYGCPMGAYAWSNRMSNEEQGTLSEGSA